MESLGKQNAAELTEQYATGESFSSRVSRDSRSQNQSISHRENPTVKSVALSSNSLQSPITTKSDLDPKPGRLGVSRMKVKEEPIAAVALSSQTITTPLKSLSLSQPASPPPTDNDTSISSSPRSPSPEVEIRPPTQKKVPAVDVSPFTPAELQEAKKLVLDLLGWGVSPDYLLTVGISHGAIYRIFTDLNLCLPSNLEVIEEIEPLPYDMPLPPPNCFQS